MPPHDDQSPNGKEKIQHRGERKSKILFERKKIEKIALLVGVSQRGFKTDASEKRRFPSMNTSTNTGSTTTTQRKSKSSKHDTMSVITCRFESVCVCVCARAPVYFLAFACSCFAISGTYRRLALTNQLCTCSAVCARCVAPSDAGRGLRRRSSAEQRRSFVRRFAC